MKYLVTGGAGFIGSNLVEELLRLNNDVIVIDDFSTGFTSNLPINNNLKVINAKIQNINEPFDKLDGIFHLAAQASVPLSINDTFNSTSNNILSSLKVFDIAKLQKIPIVFASSSAIYGNMAFGDENKQEYEILSPYALDKLTLEEYSKLFCRLFDVSSIGLRFFNVYGPKQDPDNPYSGVISIFIDKFIKNIPLTIYGGYQTRDFIYIKDVVYTLIRAMDIQKNKIVNDFINVGTGISISINDLYNSLSDIFKYKVDINYKQLNIEDPIKSAGNYNKLKNILQIDITNFTSIIDGLFHTINYIKK